MGDDIPLPLLKGSIVAMLTQVDLQKPRTRLERPGDFLAVTPPVMFPTSFFTITMCRLLHFRNELSTGKPLDDCAMSEGLGGGFLRLESQSRRRMRSGGSVRPSVHGSTRGSLLE